MNENENNEINWRNIRFYIAFVVITITLITSFPSLDTVEGVLYAILMVFLFCISGQLVLNDFLKLVIK